MKVLRNRIRCNRCGDEPESVCGHDFSRCSCGACAADGGKYYLRRVFDSRDCFTELSEVEFSPDFSEQKLAAILRDGIAMVYTISNAHLTVRVSTRGAELRSVLGADDTEYLWQGDKQYWQEQAPVLFPFVGRLPDKRYCLDGNTYEMGIHGFAAGCLFSVVEAEEDRLVLELTETEETLRQYPRRFRFRVEYTLREAVLETTFRVENRDEKTMYFGLGGHPGIRVPIETGLRFTDYRLTFPEAGESKRILFSDRCLVCGEEDYPVREGIALTHSLFDDDAVVLRDAGHRVILDSPNGKHSVTVCYPGMDYIGLWHANKTDAPYVCIEPWCSLPANEGEALDFAQKKDLLTLTPGGEYENTWTMEIR